MITAANPFACRIFGFHNRTLIGTPLQDLLPVSSRSVHGRQIAEYFKNPLNRPMGEGRELQALHYDGHTFPVEISLSYYKSGDELVAVAYISDITTRKLLVKEIGASDKNLRFFVKHAPAAIAMFDNHMHYLEASTRWCEDYRLEAGDLRGQSHYEVFPEISDEWKYFHRRGLAGETLRCEAEEFRRQDGSVEWVKWEIFPWRDVDGNIGGIVIFSELITEKVDAYEKLAQLNKELEARVHERTDNLTTLLERETELSSMKSRFLSVAAHEIKTPLSSILSSAHLLSHYSGEGDKSEREKHIERIKRAARNLSETVEEFLAMDKLEQGKMVLKIASFNYRDLLNELSAELECRLKPSQTIKTVTDGEANVIGDRTIIHNVLLNLLSNAIKYSKKDILIETVITNDKVEIDVTDHGIGIPAEEQGKLFQPFFRSKNAQSFMGTGLGLSIVKNYLELIGGAIRFISEPDHGTTFSVSFPQNKI